MSAPDSMASLSSKPLLREVALPALFLVGVTILLVVTGADVALVGLFYDPAVGWWGVDVAWVDALYEYGRWPPIGLALFALVTLPLIFALRSRRHFWRVATFLVLLAVLVPGVLINFVLKDYTGRPRPRDIAAFNGAEAYRAPFELAPPGGNKSFPSGHAGIAFYVLAPWFILRKRVPGLAWGFLLGGLIYGVLMGIARMSVGGHFPTDILWSGGLVYLGGYGLAVLLRPDAAIMPHSRASGERGDTPPR